MTKSQIERLVYSLDELLTHIEWRRRVAGEKTGAQDCTHRARSILAEYLLYKNPPHVCRKCNRTVPNEQGTVNCWHKECKE